MSSQVSIQNTEAAILGHVIEADRSEMTPALHAILLSMRLPRADSASVGCPTRLAARGHPGLHPIPTS
jgi:hypothetical protein